MTSTWMEVFMTGTHTAGNGTKKTYGEADLDNMAKLYNDQKDHEAPLVLGHPTMDGPAFGWAKELKRAGNKLLAYVDQISDDVVEAVKNGSYKKISIAIYPNGVLRHIGLLGATPPAVKGLAPVQFAEGLEFDEYVWATDEYRMPTVSRIFSNIRDFFIEKFGIDKTDKMISKDDIEYLRDPAKNTMFTIVDNNTSKSISIPPEGAITNNYSEQEEEIIMEKLRQQITDLESKLKTQGEEFAEKVTGIEKGFKDLSDLITLRFSESDKNIKASAKETAKAAFLTFCEGLIAAGKILPAEKDMIVEEYADLLKAEETLTFSEGETKLSDKMKKRLEARPVIITRTEKVFARKEKVDGQPEVPAEFAEMNVDENSIEIDKQIKTYAEEHKCSYEEAADRFSAA